MAFEHGSGAHFSVDNAATSLTDISAYITSVDGLPGTVDSHDTTTYGDSAHEKSAGLKDVAFTVQGIFDATCDAVLGAVLGLVGTYSYGPQGSTAADIRYYGEALLVSYGLSDPVAGMVTWTARFEGVGACTRGTFPV
jgi:hypothetical protein